MADRAGVRTERKALLVSFRARTATGGPPWDAAYAYCTRGALIGEQGNYPYCRGS